MTKKVFNSDSPTRKLRLLIEAILARHHWTQKELAQALGTSEFAISRWMTGKHKPRQKILKALEDIYNNKGTPQLPESPKIVVDQLTIPVTATVPLNQFLTALLEGALASLRQGGLSK